MQYAAININFDSLGEGYGFEKDYRDPCFHEVAERFFDIATRLKFKYSIYIIGKDLEKKDNAKAVKKWSEQGHEIGNHSFSHPLNLGALPWMKLYDEIKKSHDIITQTIGYEPKGFIAPGWSTSANVIKILNQLNYEYDTSTFPSILMYASLLKMVINHITDSRLKVILKRKDWLNPIFANRNAHICKSKSGSIVSLPLPSTKIRIACWHTWQIYKKTSPRVRPLFCILPSSTMYMESMLPQGEFIKASSTTKV